MPTSEPLPLEETQIPGQVPGTPEPIRPDQIPATPIRNRPATTTLQQDIGADSRRAVNLIWEKNQERISLGVVSASMLVCSILALMSLNPNATERQYAIANTALTFLITISVGISNFYFQRTNHEKVGGVGATVEEESKGRSGKA